MAHQSKEFLNCIRHRVRNIKHVLDLDREGPRQKKRIRIAQIQAIDDRDEISGGRQGAVRREFRNELGRLETQQENPCRVGTVRQEEALHRLAAGKANGNELEVLADLTAVMRDASICGLGQTAASAVESAMMNLGVLVPQ